MRDPQAPLRSWAVQRSGSGLGSVLLHVPHAGTIVPAFVRSELLLDEAALERELAQMTDWHTDGLATGALEASGVPGQVFINRLSRLVVDPERLPDEEEPMATIGMGAVYQVTSDLRPLRRPDPSRDALLRAEYFDPYTAALADLVDELLEALGEATIIDLHSYPSRALPYELDQAADRPGICIGTDPFHSPEALVDKVREAFSPLGQRVGLDTPFAGTYVPLAHLHRTRAVSSVMVELRRDLYLDETTGQLTSGYDELVSCLGAFIASLDRRSHQA